MSQAELIQLIFVVSTMMGIEPEIVLAVAKTETNLNPDAVGTKGERGLLQVMPKYSSVNPEMLSVPAIGLVEGIKHLKWARKHCPFQENNTWLICFNRGITGSLKVEKPYENAYYLKFVDNYDKLSIASND